MMLATRRRRRGANNGRRQSLLRAVAVLGTIALLLVGPASPAWAHAGLADSDPIDGEAVAVAPATVTLTFNQSIPPEFVTVTLHSDAGAVTLTAPPAVNDRTVTQPLPSLPNGRYTVGYRVVSEDGHPITGAIRFSVEIPGTPTAQPTQQAAPPAEPPAANTGVPAWVWLLISTAVIGAAVAAFLRLSRNADRT